MKNILFATSEAVPFIKTGGLADVAGALPKCFDKRYFDVRVILPKYACMKQEWKDRMEYITHFYMDLGYKNCYVGIMHLEYEGIHFYFIDNEYYFSGPKPYDSAPWDLEKFAFFSKAVLSVLPVINFRPDVIHCHGWMTALAPLYIKKAYKDEPSFRDAKVVFSVYEDDFKNTLSDDFATKLMLKGITKKDLGDLKEPVDYAALCKLAVDYSDGIIQNSEKVDESIIEYARQSGKLVLDYQSPENYANACNEFYDQVWETTTNKEEE